MLLAGDIGGTKTRLALFSTSDGPRAPLVEATYASAEYDAFEDLVADFLRGCGHRIRVASFGVAGPVVDRKATITNLRWVLDEKVIGDTLELSGVHLLNDLVAMANAVPILEAHDVCTLREGQPVAGGTMAVVAPGTGLGEAFLVWDGTRYRAHPSEGGHADFAPTDELETELLIHLKRRHAHVSFERVCSGRWLPNIYDFLRERGVAPQPDWLAEQLANVSDRTPLIINAALDTDRKCPLCTATLDMFISILGSEAGNAALKFLATGGMYIGGGIPPRILAALKSPVFLEKFHNKGRLSDLLRQIPVHVVINSDAPLFGAARFGLEFSMSEGISGAAR